MLISVLALAVTALLVEVARRVAPAVGLTDTPNERKPHDGEIPLVGGIAIFLGLLVILAFREMLLEHWVFFVSAGLLVAVGGWDDAFGISPLLRLAFQATAVLLIATVGDTYVADLGRILPIVGTLELGWLAVPFTVFIGVGAINAFNMSDGVDGLCGTLTLVALTGLGLSASLAGSESDLLLILTLVGGLVGFLLFNVRLPHRKQAIVFLGDAGSYLLGLAVVYLAIRLSQGADRAIAPVTALWFCMLPLLDTAGMILRRLRRGASPFRPDREHLHHVFLLAKFSVTATWLGLTIIALAGMVLGLVGLIGGLPESVMFAAFLIVGVSYYGMILRVWKALKFLSRSINRRVKSRIDRRTGSDRRKLIDSRFLDGSLEERRSGLDRRAKVGDRRSDPDWCNASVGASDDRYASECNNANRAA
jgi:UDP-GlcNAc:undecaprenyl-phosphate GlcNAc-1-phosphate transferase